MQSIAQILASELGQPVQYVENVIALLDEGSTIPFIARYRKEQHGSMDDTTLRKLEDRLQYLRNLDKRRQEVKSAIEGQGKLTEALAAAIDSAATLAEVEDLYRPYKQKRRTRATVAREKGLEPLAQLLLAQEKDCPAPETAAQAYIDPEKGVETAADALQGANDIIAEIISDDADIRKALRGLLMRQGRLRSLAATEEDSVYRLYYDFEQAIPKLAGHQILAINRGEKEGLLSVTVLLDREAALPALRRAVVKPGSAAMEFIKAACEDAYDRLIYPSLEREARSALTDSANEGAIGQFALNLKPLLLQPPVKGHVTMGLDPGYAHGCKVAVIDGTGKVLDTTVVYPTYGERQKREAIAKLTALCKKHGVAHIAIGNGTASRETEQMTVEMLRGLPGVSYMIVNEAGASVYSAGKLAAEEFPDYDVTVRGAVSIGRRLIDPLSELVKIDPKSIGVGQYQHSVDPAKLKARLRTVVESCVNRVGVNINTASKHILTYISGLGPVLAQNIVAYRAANGEFKSRRALLKVPRLGAKAFEQAAGFLRVVGGANPLDNSAVHPESYAVVERMAADAGVTVERLLTDKQLRSGLKAERYVSEEAGLPTVTDILEALDKRGLDPREQLQVFAFDPNVHTIGDLREGMLLPGIVTNITAFGAFVDIGVKQDGLVHISQLADRYVASPADVVHLGQHVEVRVTGVDTVRGRIALSMRREA